MYIFLALFILAVIPPVMCKGQHEDCNVLPKDQYIEVGSNIDVMCLTSCVHEDTFWTLNNRELDESMSHIINSSHTVLSLRNFTHQSAVVQCHSADTKQVLGGTTIRTYSKPMNISCLWHNENQEKELLPDLFTCTWEHQINPSLEINYTVLIASEFNRKPQEICKSRKTTCRNVPDYSLINELDPINITVRAKTASWEVDSDPREFKPSNILQMIRPQLTATTLSDHVLVEWKGSYRSEECHCEVKYSKAVKERTIVVELNDSLKRGRGKVAIEEVESCSNYTFSVRCALVTAPWSEWSKEKTVLTKLKKKDVKLRLWRNVAEPLKKGVRKIHAMWKKIPSTCQETFTYMITQTPYKEHMMAVNRTNTSCDKSSCDVDVNQHAHRINLKVFHNETPFVEDSVYVPAIGGSLPQVTNILSSTLDNEILVSWKAPVQPVRGYVIDWTHDGNQYYWMESKYTNATLSGLLDKQPYNVTVTPLFDDKTGHGTQALHICSRIGGPGNVTIHVQANDRSALVDWSVKSQEACSGVVVYYTVFYSKQKETELNVSVNGTEQVISLKDLHPDTQYNVYVKATALTGTTKSIEMLFKTKRFGLLFISTVSVCGIIVIILVLSLGLCCAVWWKKYRQKPVPNPGFSSLALWPAASREEGMCPFQPFSNPSESVCDRVYTEETQKTSSSPVASGCIDYPSSDQTEEYVDPDAASERDVQNEDPVEPAGTQCPSSPDDLTTLLPSDNGLCSPYRSQISVESPGSRSRKQSKRVPVKQPDKTTPVTVYVTLDMLEQMTGQVREIETKT